MRVVEKSERREVLRSKGEEKEKKEKEKISRSGER